MATITQQSTTKQSVNKRTNSKNVRSTTVSQKRRLALLLPGHNEELILATTIKSALASGQALQDIFVVDDNSSDNTRKIALKHLPRQNVLSVERSGKALAVYKAVQHFKIVERYTWLHVADADSIFGADYFRIYKKGLDAKKYAVAVGFVQSLRGNWISTYRALNYTYSQQVIRRVQSYLGMISVFPGPITCFRTNIIPKLDFDTGSLTEDFDITLQVHRKRLGAIKYIPRAVNYTQDPETIKDFCKQTSRWQRGLFQGVKKYKIGTKWNKIDLSIGFQLFQAALYVAQYWILLPFIIIKTHNWIAVPVMFAVDFIVMGVIALAASAAIKRWNVLGALPYFYLLRWLELIIFYKAFVEVIILRKYQSTPVGWSTEGRRYAVKSRALADTAK
jgi:biofilm PGA synthesis N-glycosyltransferase PgaC